MLAEIDAVTTVEELLRDAVAHGASDVHLDPVVGGYRLRLRKDGQLRPWRSLDADLGAQVVGRLKSLAELLVYRNDLPQEGCIARDDGADTDEVRVSTYPAAGGERVALRFVEARSRRLDELGLPEGVRAELGARLDGGGVLLLTGPSGSGKTTTLYACLREILERDPSRSIVTVEDPIERRIPDVVQTELRPSAGLDGATALRSLMRQDPDVLMFGEIRDPASARLVFEAGLTGHLVLSTLHGGSPQQVQLRLKALGVDEYTARNTLRGILSQRLVASAPHAGRTLVTDWLPIDGEKR